MIETVGITRINVGKFSAEITAAAKIRLIAAMDNQLAVTLFKLTNAGMARRLHPAKIIAENLIHLMFTENNSQLFVITGMLIHIGKTPAVNGKEIPPL